MAKIKNLLFDFGGVLVKIDVFKAIEAFKALGFTDVDKELDPYVQKGFYLSFELKNMKPRKEIFEMVLAHEGFNADETLFIDDGEINLKGAQALGLHTFLPLNGELWGKRLEQELNIVIR